MRLPPAPEPDPYSDPIALALVAEFSEHGGGATTAGICRRSGVAADEFGRRFHSLEDCALDSYERFIAALERRVGGAFNRGPDWREGVRAAAYETADWMEESPEVVEFGATGILSLRNELARVRREEVFRFFAAMIDRGRASPGAGAEIDGSTAMFCIGSIMQLLTHRLQSGTAIEPHAIVPEMLFMVVRAYLGEEAAREELLLPRPEDADREN